ncbi:hypothetical protein BKA67DRAFT_537221 [Truncatella angustata]|uniref:Uncharacterized protein n=1 Tax=Truncatella angustata TaxID=152316 RepID=A0A9P8UKB7_9PEZI|nr:uncharacterized protein BKA67DRAFT_537221 [Truncatella angustata]KAH6653578.1 hypothetical protein BKA67DRAFT_537221 [Truncatella angustata]
MTPKNTYVRPRSDAFIGECLRYIRHVGTFARAVVQENDRLQRLVKQLSAALCHERNSSQLQAQVVQTQQTLIKIWETQRIAHRECHCRLAAHERGQTTTRSALYSGQCISATNKLMVLADVAEKERRSEAGVKRKAADDGFLGPRESSCPA